MRRTRPNWHATVRPLPLAGAPRNDRRSASGTTGRGLRWRFRPLLSAPLCCRADGEVAPRPEQPQARLRNPSGRTIRNRGHRSGAESKAGGRGSDPCRPDGRAPAARAAQAHDRRPLQHREGAGGPGHTAKGGARVSAANPARLLTNYRLRLIVAGSTHRSRRAIENLQRLCREHLSGRVDLEIIDIYQQPELAEKYKVIAAPTLVKLLPVPVRRIIGDLSQQDRVLRGLEIPPSPRGGSDVC